MGNCFSGSDSKPPPARSQTRKHNASIVRTPPSFGLESMYETIHLLGKGGEGETWLCKDKSSGELVAIKLIKRPIPFVVWKVVKREITIQADLGKGHINLVSAQEAVLTHSYLGLVMEYVDGGNMVAYVSKRRDHRDIRTGLCLDEDEARYFFRQIIGAVEFCHKKQVAHRDLKLDNTLVNSQNPPRIKLCDFGFAKAFDTANDSHTNTLRVGTPEYMGPELISSRDGYDGKKVDVWACGVLLYVMLFGKFPFESTEDENDTNAMHLMYGIWLQQLKKNWRDQPGNAGDADKISQDCCDLLDRMFDMKQETRISIQSIKQHSWFVKALLPKYQRAFDEMQSEQGRIDLQTASGFCHRSDREKAVEVMVRKAATQGSTSEEPIRLKLSGPMQGQIPASLLNGADAGLPTMNEEEEEASNKASNTI